MKIPGTKWLGRLKISLGITLFFVLLPVIVGFNALVGLSILLRKGFRGINREEALAICDKQVARFRSMSYEQVNNLLNNGDYREDFQEAAESGVEYNVCVHAWFFMPSGSLIAVEITVNDDGWSQYMPICSFLAVAPEEGWIGGRDIRVPEELTN